MSMPDDNAVETSGPAAEKGDVAKNKLVRDSFTIPKAEYAALNELKQRATRLSSPAKKSELIRAGIELLKGLNDQALLQALAAVPALKTGRPRKEGEAEGDDEGEAAPKKKVIDKTTPRGAAAEAGAKGAAKPAKAANKPARPVKPAKAEKAARADKPAKAQKAAQKPQRAEKAAARAANKANKTKA